MSQARSGRWAPYVSVWRSTRLRRAVLAYLGYAAGEYGTWVAILVYALDKGGVGLLGVAASIQLAPAAVMTPILTALGSRYSLAARLRLSYALQAVALLVVALTIYLDLTSR